MAATPLSSGALGVREVSGVTADGRKRWTLVLFACATLLLACASVPAATLLVHGSRRPDGGAPAVAAAAGSVSSLNAVEGRRSVTDASGRRWSPDPFSHGGSLVSRTVGIRNTRAPALYASQRVGVDRVTVPLRANGTYLVVLYFAETTRMSAGHRVFDVLAQGHPVASHVDIVRDAGSFTPYHLAFTVVVSQRRLALRFLARRGQALLSAIAIRAVDPAVQLPARQVVWHDEFNGSRAGLPDPAHWTYDVGPGWEQSADYTRSPANASTDGRGHLVLSASNQPYADPNGHNYSLTSARLTTQGLYEMLYGVASARIRVSDRPGFVSTFWALGTDVNQVQWPRSGELDPEEVRGLRPSVLVQALHMPFAQHDLGIVWDRRTGTSLARGFHTFTVEHAPGVVVYLMDGKQTGSLTAADVPRGSWVFDKPFYLILNLMVGGVWAHEPPPTTRWPVSMSVDWVRVSR